MRALLKILQRLLDNFHHFLCVFFEIVFFQTEESVLSSDLGTVEWSGVRFFLFAFLCLSVHDQLSSDGKGCVSIIQF